ncbi:thioredoxin family protein [Metabacillus malikii]|uniref:Thiol-disulfide isomerase/thioredoxin n=1 Tax=Metabacillus malikii TaxID=1504265 RepID=A0ABT9ZL17_9BACI|nr:thioredoxin family protein [Metabacillus malikii]MDQ0232477.1 thiol-disulfide isomerase/thioredoxin [Metabacillus malikii]
MEQLKTDEQFQQFIASEEPVVVKFVTDWCPDCKRMDMFLPTVFEEVKDVNMKEIDKDEFPEIAEKYDVMGIPSLLVFKKGEKQAHLHSANAKTPDQVIEFLSSSVK